MIGELISRLLPLVIPIAGVFIVLVLLAAPSTRPGTSAKPEGRDHREDRRQSNAEDRS